MRSFNTLTKAKDTRYAIPKVENIPGTDCAVVEAKAKRQNEARELRGAIRDAITLKAASGAGRGGRQENATSAPQEYSRTVLPLGAPRSPKAYREPDRSTRPANQVTAPECNATQRRLLSTAGLSGVRKFRDHPTRIFSGQGDVCRAPDHNSKVMLATTNGARLTIKDRAADFRSEVDWRVKLRENTYAYLPEPRPPMPAVLQGRVPRILPTAAP